MAKPPAGAWALPAIAGKPNDADDGSALPIPRPLPAPPQVKESAEETSLSDNQKDLPISATSSPGYSPSIAIPPGPGTFPAYHGYYAPPPPHHHQPPAYDWGGSVYNPQAYVGGPGAYAGYSSPGWTPANTQPGPDRSYHMYPPAAPVDQASSSTLPGGFPAASSTAHSSAFPGPSAPQPYPGSGPHQPYPGSGPHQPYSGPGFSVPHQPYPGPAPYQPYPGPAPPQPYPGPAPPQPYPNEHPISPTPEDDPNQSRVRQLAQKFQGDLDVQDREREAVKKLQARAELAKLQQEIRDLKELQAMQQALEQARRDQADFQRIQNQIELAKVQQQVEALREEKRVKEEIRKLKLQQRKDQLLREIEEEKQAIALKEKIAKARLEQANAAELAELNRELELVKMKREVERHKHRAAMDGIGEEAAKAELAQAQKKEAELKLLIENLQARIECSEDKELNERLPNWGAPLPHRVKGCTIVSYSLAPLLLQNITSGLSAVAVSSASSSSSSSTAGSSTITSGASTRSRQLIFGFDMREIESCMLESKRREFKGTLQLEPFAKGSFRYAYWMRTDSTNPDTKSQKHVGKHMIDKFRDPLLEAKALQEGIFMHLLGALVCEAFNKKKPSSAVAFRMAPAFLLDWNSSRPSGTRQYWALEAELENSDSWVKFNNNQSFQLDKYGSPHAETAQALSHFSYDFFQGQIMMVDIQGTTSPGFVTLTDPAFHCQVWDAFGLSNLAGKGFTAFFSNHKCESVCKAMSLKPHPAQR